MTIGWGLLGTLWGKPVAMVYVRPSRYTYEFMEINNTFSITAFSKSGREINKMKIDGLTPKEVEKTVFFTEAELVLICKKTYFNDLVPDHIPEESKLTYYNSGDYHRVYYGEILNCYKND